LALKFFRIFEEVIPNKLSSKEPFQGLKGPPFKMGMGTNPEFGKKIILKG